MSSRRGHFRWRATLVGGAGMALGVTLLAAFYVPAYL